MIAGCGHMMGCILIARDPLSRDHSRPVGKSVLISLLYYRPKRAHSLFLWPCRTLLEVCTIRPWGPSVGSWSFQLLHKVGSQETEATANI